MVTQDRLALEECPEDVWICLRGTNAEKVAAEFGNIEDVLLRGIWTTTSRYLFLCLSKHIKLLLSESIEDLR